MKFIKEQYKMFKEQYDIENGKNCNKIFIHKILFSPSLSTSLAHSRVRNQITTIVKCHILSWEVFSLNGALTFDVFPALGF